MADYTFTTTPTLFSTDLVASPMPSQVKTAVQAVWAANDHAGADYEVSAATGATWTVVRVAQVIQEG